MSPRSRGWIVLAAAVVGIGVTANLGAWQLRRAAQKIALQQSQEARAQQPEVSTATLAGMPGEAALQYGRPVRLRGRWVREHNVFLENRQVTGGRVGFYVVTPLLLDGRRDAVLVQRGWVPRDQRDRTLLPPVPSPSGPVEIVGHVAPPPGRLYEFAPSVAGLIRQNLDLGEFTTETGLRLAPLSVQQSDSPGTVGDGLVRDWPHPAADVQKHYGYAFQWFAMGALMAGLYVWFQLVRPWRERHARA